jgi:uncharacterized protein YjbI with pentapeptide repeats
LDHLDSDVLQVVLSGLKPGDPLDFRGNPVSEQFLGRLRQAMTDPDRQFLIGRARFEEATFSGDAWFTGATFTGDAGFTGATFTGDAWFGRATFTGTAWFDGATFTGVAWFDGATFTGVAGFAGATFSGDAGFREAPFDPGGAELRGAHGYRHGAQRRQHRASLRPGKARVG